MRKTNVSQFGFTLIEVIVVVGILGILAVSALLTINPFEQIKKSNDTQRKANLEQIQRALTLYYQDHGVYPASSGGYQIIDATGNTNKTITWGSSWQPYMNVLPSDPKNSQSYIYYAPVNANGQTYYLYASLERGQYDPQACNNGKACSSLSANGIAATACGGVCNYGVSSPNVSP